MATLAYQWREESPGSFCFIYEDDVILIASEVDQWRRIRRTDIQDLTIGQTFWWEPAFGLSLIVIAINSWRVSPKMALGCGVIFGIFRLVFKLRYITMMSGTYGCVVRVRFPIEQLASFLDWLDAPDASLGAGLGPVRLDHGAALASRGWFDSKVPVGRLGHLHRLLSCVFVPSSLRRFILYHYEFILAELPYMGSMFTPNQMVDHAVDFLARHGVVNTNFFALLLKIRGGYTDMIRACAIAWEIDNFDEQTVFNTQKRDVAAPTGTEVGEKSAQH